MLYAKTICKLKNYSHVSAGRIQIKNGESMVYIIPTMKNNGENGLSTIPIPLMKVTSKGYQMFSRNSILNNNLYGGTKYNNESTIKKNFKPEEDEMYIFYPLINVYMNYSGEEYNVIKKLQYLMNGIIKSTIRNDEEKTIVKLIMECIKMFVDKYDTMISEESINRINVSSDKKYMITYTSLLASINCNYGIYMVYRILINNGIYPKQLYIDEDHELKIRKNGTNDLNIENKTDINHILWFCLYKGDGDEGAYHDDKWIIDKNFGMRDTLGRYIARTNNNKMMYDYFDTHMNVEGRRGRFPLRVIIPAKDHVVTNVINNISIPYNVFEECLNKIKTGENKKSIDFDINTATISIVDKEQKDVIALLQLMHDTPSLFMSLITRLNKIIDIEQEVIFPWKITSVLNIEKNEKDVRKEIIKNISKYTDGVIKSKIS